MNDKNIIKELLSETIQSPHSADFDRKVMSRIKAEENPLPAPSLPSFRVTPVLLWGLALLVLLLNAFFMLKPYIISLNEKQLFAWFTTFLSSTQSLIFFAVVLAASALFLLDALFQGKRNFST